MQGSSHPQQARLEVVGSWVPAFFGMAVICVESTRSASAAHTLQWLITAIIHFHAQAYFSDIAETNTILRKSGHFMGYGLLALLFARGWLALLTRYTSRTWASVARRAGTLGVLSAAVIATLDEIHQSFLPGRTASGHDVALDTAGAILMVAFYFAVRTLRSPMAFSSLRLQLPRRTSASQARRRRLQRRSVTQIA